MSAQGGASNSVGCDGTAAVVPLFASALKEQISFQKSKHGCDVKSL